MRLRWLVSAGAALALAGCGLAPPAPEVKTGTLPDLNGKGLQYAQDAAQQAGFRSLTSHDSSGRGRHSILDRDWKVCFQSPAPGVLPLNTKVDFGVVKTDETCPTKDALTANGDASAATMPNVVGSPLPAANAALGANASVTYVDGLGTKRSVIVQSNWKVCAQTPRAGEPYAGVPVTLTVVKSDESCGANV
jgi:beta-lactam-binding protein with PASTA domain